MAKYRIVEEKHTKYEHGNFHAEKVKLLGWEYVDGTIADTAEEAEALCRRFAKIPKVVVIKTFRL